MATSYRFPGVYSSITDLSGVVAVNAVTSCGYVGESEYGPINTPTLITNLQDFTNKFGALSSKYGYAGYSLAVASETISSNYFVRVVPTGDPAADPEERVNDAHWAAATVSTKDADKIMPVSTGYFYEEVTAAQTARDAGEDSGLFKSEDMESAFMVVANDPNNRKLYITTEDSTINDNKASAVLEPTTFEALEGADAGKTMVSVFLPKSIVDGMEVGDYIVVSKMSNAELNGVFKVEDFSVLDQKATVKYKVNAEVTEVNDSAARIGRFPDSNQQTFSLKVMEKVGRVMQTLESFDFCTLYPSQDSYGNSIFLEDVVNGNSNYIQVFVNKNVTEDGDVIVIPNMVTEIELAGGKSGTWKDGNAKYTDLVAAWEHFRDASQVQVSLLLNSGYVLKENVSYQSKMLEIAESRRDCFCLFDCPMTETDYDDLIDWRKNIQGFNSYRGAVSAPWVKTYDSVQGRSNFVMCPSAYVAKIMGAYDPWLAPAGLNRGIISSSIVSPTGLTQYFDETRGGNLYTDNQINLMIKNPASGYVNWGQRTLQAKPSALDRINVARTVIYIETVLRDSAKWYIFENNTAYNRMQVTMQFNSFLNTILASEGIQSFRVVCDTSNNTPQVIANNQLVVDIYLQPTYCAEFIILNTYIESGVATTTVSIGS